MLVKIIFWTLIGFIIYCYLGYTLILSIISILKKRKNNPEINENDLPPITFVIAAYNEREVALEKVRNTFGVDYPKDKVFQLWVTDGSNDGTQGIIKGIENVEVIHQPERKGKTAALNRAMAHVKTPITIFSDANTFISPQSAKLIAREFFNPKVGCVVGEKRIMLNQADNAVTSGEGAYWKYESLIKKFESDCGSTLSAAGELYAIRTELFENVEEDIILDDFIVSTNIRQKRYCLKYVPAAFTIEKASMSIHEEKKRKRRIAAGAFQTLFRYPQMMNPLKNPYFSFQYISHKVLRWLFVPFSLLAVPLLNLAILLFISHSKVYYWTFIFQVLFFLVALAGSISQNRRIREKTIFIPFYLVLMNFSVIEGLWEYLKNRHSVIWEKSVRQS